MAALAATMLSTTAQATSLRQAVENYGVWLGGDSLTVADEFQDGWITQIEALGELNRISMTSFSLNEVNAYIAVITHPIISGFSESTQNVIRTALANNPDAATSFDGIVSTLVSISQTNIDTIVGATAESEASKLIRNAGENLSEETASAIAVTANTLTDNRNFAVISTNDLENFDVREATAEDLIELDGDPED